MMTGSRSTSNLSTQIVMKVKARAGGVTSRNIGVANDNLQLHGQVSKDDRAQQYPSSNQGLTTSASDVNHSSRLFRKSRSTKNITAKARQFIDASALQTREDLAW